MFLRLFCLGIGIFWLTLSAPSLPAQVDFPATEEEVTLPEVEEAIRIIHQELAKSKGQLRQAVTPADQARLQSEVQILEKDIVALEELRQELLQREQPVPPPYEVTLRKARRIERILELQQEKKEILKDTRAAE